jgi:MFS family permease
MNSESQTKKKIFFVLFVSIFSCMLGVGIIVPILPIYAETLGATGFWLGAIFAAFSLSRTISMPLVGRFSDRLGRKRFISLGLLVYTFSSLGYIYANSALELVAVRIIQGLSSAMIIPIAMAFIADISPPDKEGSYMGIFTAALFLGFGFGPFLGGLTKDLIGMKADFLIMGGLCFLAFFMVLIYLPRSSSIQNKSPSTDIPFKTILQSRSIMAICFYRFANAFCRGSIMTFLPLYAHNSLQLNGRQIGLVISSGILLTTVFLLPFGKLADKLNRKMLVILGSILYFVIVPFIPHTLSFIQILTLNIILGLFGALSLPAASALIVKEGKQYGMGQTMAIFNVAMSLGLGVGPLASGVVLDIWGLSGVFYFCTILGFLGIGIVALLFSKRFNPQHEAL